MRFSRLSPLALVALPLGLLGWSFGDERELAPPPPAAQASPPRGRVLINRGPDTPRVPTDRRARDGAVVTVACSTCHSVREPNLDRRDGDTLRGFHQGLTTAHGSLSCLSCHDARDYDRLKLADGAPVAFPDVLALCGQCHGPQLRDYRHGAHGGMQGAWDLRAGDRVRNTCVDCHDAHAPAYPVQRPVFPPAKDRRHE